MASTPSNSQNQAVLTCLHSPGKNQTEIINRPKYRKSDDQVSGNSLSDTNGLKQLQNKVTVLSLSLLNLFSIT